MSTGVVVNGYEIRNRHTVSILELARARREQGQPVVVPVKREMSKKMKRRSKDMREMKISEEEVRGLYDRYFSGESLVEVAGEYDISSATAVNYFKRLGLVYPRPKVLAVPPTPDEQLAATPPADVEQMDEPEAVDAAAPTEPEPATEITLQDVWTQVKERTRELRERVGAVQELPSPVLARKQYQPPQVLAFGNLHGVNVDNAMPVARMVGKLVEELNGIPGVKTSFNFSYSMHVGA